MKNVNMERVINYLNRQREACIDQTGITPSIADYTEHLQSEEFERWADEHIDDEYFAIDIDMDTIINYLFENHWR